MPSPTEDLIPDFDDLESTPAVVAEHTDEYAAEEPSPWAAPTLGGKKSKKKKAKKHAPRAKLEDEEDTPYAKSITPSPPAEYGVKVRGPSPDPSPPVAPVQIEEPLVDFDDETTAVEEPEPPPSPPPVRSPVVRSPRPAAAKPASPAVSPPYRPASLHSPLPHHASLANSRPQSSLGQAPQTRRESFAKQASPRPNFVEAPPPHMPQSHFFGLPDLGFNLNQKQETGRTAGSDGYCCRYDSLSDAGDAASAKKARDALLVGSEGGLDVYRILPDKLEVVGRLEGLRGGVIDAKVVPHTRLSDSQQALRPLVVTIVHGPMAGASETAKQSEAPSHYQTSVDIYSLQTQQHVANLYKSTLVATEVPVMGHLALPPPPVEDLSVDAKGEFITVASGKSCEIFIFSCSTSSVDELPQYRCIAKLWTSLRSKPDHAAPASNAGDVEPEKTAGVPLLSLSDRWLAFVPPYSSGKNTIQGSPALLQSNSSPAGVATHTAPVQPPITCEVAGVDAEGTLSWLSRRAAQSLVSASHRGYEFGVQGWRELTHPSVPAHQRAASGEREAFPPTLAGFDDPKRLAKEPALVCVVDLQSLLTAEEQKLKQPPAPMATFALVEGCNHLSFSPDGLRLLTSSRKGEVSSVWDLQRVAHGSTKRTAGDQAEGMGLGPQVTLLQRIMRSSPSLIIDSVWSRDGDWLAVLTAQGTVHLHGVLTHRSSKKRKRRSTVTATTVEKAEPTVSVSQGVSPPSSSSMWGTLRSGLQNVGTHVNNLRSQSGSAAFPIPTTFAGFKEATAAAGTAGSRVVARGFSQGFSAAKGGASDMWHAEDNKVRHKPLQESARTGCLRWAQRQSGTSLLVVCGGSVHLHPVQRVTRRQGDAITTGLKQEKYARKTFALPRISTIREEMATGKSTKCADEGPHGFWSLRHSAAPEGRRADAQNAPPPASQANEVETNPPYCPFHVDPRVNIFAVDDESRVTQEWQCRGQGLPDEEQWLFGDPLPPSTKMNDPSQSETDDAEHDDNDVDTDDVADQMESRLTIHEAGDGREESIKVNTRRSRRTNDNGAQYEEGGYDVMDDDDSMM